MSDAERFEDATRRIKAATDLGPSDLLRLYGLYKQATAGDASGERPGALDFKGRAKFDAWSALAGMTVADAQRGYVQLVDELPARAGKG